MTHRAIHAHSASGCTEPVTRFSIICRQPIEIENQGREVAPAPVRVLLVPPARPFPPPRAPYSQWMKVEVVVPSPSSIRPTSAHATIMTTLLLFCSTVSIIVARRLTGRRLFRPTILVPSPVNVVKHENRSFGESGRLHLKKKNYSVT